MNWKIEKSRAALVASIPAMNTILSEEIARYCNARNLEILAASIAGEYYKVHVVDAFGYKDTVWYSID